MPSKERWNDIKEARHHAKMTQCYLEINDYVVGLAKRYKLSLPDLYTLLDEQQKLVIKAIIKKAEKKG